MGQILDIDAGVARPEPLALGEQVKAVLAVTSRARDVDDARELLAMLGLHELPDGPRIDQADAARLTGALLAVRRAQARSGRRTASP